jgi:protein gp37
MNKAKWHTFQVLTKRADRLEKIASKLKWTPNIWLGVTVESENQKQRIPYLINTPAKIKYLSIEPMITPINDLSLNNIDWVIVGGESGPGSRPIKEQWVTSIRDNCIKNQVPFFFKQWGGINKKAAGCLLEGKYWKELPV